ncbi:unnamed protein product [Musa acuminata subsp. malaccensis]|uniref:(wild Malaysian banana) hypothetical protein n=1 Tax=Musa acuminata subsp. malaccensis TaxID=214687 RepID=A0A804HUS3_MUSAM|nr:unnamed protein product [Musa acuminata subsp. malaccensis]
MLQLLLAVALSAAPLTLYVPSLRRLSPFMEAFEALLREAAESSSSAYLRFRLGVRRILVLVSYCLR